MATKSFKLHIDVENAAFKDNPSELAAILRKVADKVENGYQIGNCMDSNGNSVGKWAFISKGGK